MNKRPMKGYCALVIAIFAVFAFGPVSFAGMLSTVLEQKTSAPEMEKPAKAVPTPATAAEPPPALPAVKEGESKKEAVVVMPLIVSGGVARDEVGSFESALIESLSGKYKVYSGKKVQDTVEKVYRARSEEAKAGKECDDTKCLQDIAIEFQTELIAVCSVKKMPGGGFMLSLKIQNVIEDTVPFSKAVPCENCNEFAAIRALQGMIAVQAATPTSSPVAATPIAPSSKTAVQTVPTKQGHFTDNSDGTVTDNVTGLMWQKKDDGKRRNWPSAGSYCTGLSLGGYSDWRLPTKEYLERIVDKGYKPTIDSKFFTNTQSEDYWSSTTNAGIFAYKWAVSFNDGSIDDYGEATGKYVRCVRLGQ